VRHCFKTTPPIPTKTSKKQNQKKEQRGKKEKKILS
jgi:hypothetical protein